MDKNKKYDYILCGYNVEIMDKIIEVIKNEKRGKTLDVGAGQGAMSQKLKRLGFDVYACDLEPRHFKPKNIPIIKVDLGKKLPYHSLTFQNLVCSEVFEHLENPWQTFKELSRILKKDGIFILSVPNFSNIISRFVFFTRGNFRQFDEWYWQNWGHINPITFTEIRMMAKNAGFEIIEVTTQEQIKNIYTVCLFFVQKIISFLFHFYKIHLVGSDRQDKSLSFLDTETLLYGENIIIKFRKVKESQKSIYA